MLICIITASVQEVNVIFSKLNKMWPDLGYEFSVVTFFFPSIHHQGQHRHFFSKSTSADTYILFLNPFFHQLLGYWFYMKLKLIDFPPYRAQVCLPLQGAIKTWSLNPASAPKTAHLLDFHLPLMGVFSFYL